MCEKFIKFSTKNQVLPISDPSHQYVVAYGGLGRLLVVLAKAISKLDYSTS